MTATLSLVKRYAACAWVGKHKGNTYPSTDFSDY